MHKFNHEVAINSNPTKGEIVVLFSGEAHTPPLHHVGPSVLDYHLLHYVVSGQGSYQSLGREYELHGGQSFFIFPGELTHYCSHESDPWHYRWIGFRGTHVDQWLSTIGISINQPVIQAVNRRIPILFHRIFRTLQANNPQSDLQAGGWIRLLFGEYAAALGNNTAGSRRKLTLMQEQVAQAIRFLSLQYNRPISIDQMAQELGYHRTHFSKMFRQETGLSPSQYLLKIRMERASILLHEPLTIEQVAASVGYVDPLYFSKQFKKTFQVTPTDYRLQTAPYRSFDCSR